MSAPTRPSAPWHVPLTRRLTLLRLGLPTVVACLLVVGPGVAVSAERGMTRDLARLMARTTTAGGALLGDGPPPRGDQREGDGRRAGARPAGGR